MFPYETCSHKMSEHVPYVYCVSSEEKLTTESVTRVLFSSTCTLSQSLISIQIYTAVRGSGENSRPEVTVIVLFCGAAPKQNSTIAFTEEL